MGPVNLPIDYRRTALQLAILDVFLEVCGVLLAGWVALRVYLWWVLR
jgi:hypothetical protein